MLDSEDRPQTRAQGAGFSESSLSQHRAGNHRGPKVQAAANDTLTRPPLRSAQNPPVPELPKLEP